MLTVQIQSEFGVVIQSVGKTSVSYGCSPKRGWQLYRYEEPVVEADSSQGKEPGDVFISSKRPQNITGIFGKLMRKGVFMVRDFNI